MIVEFPQAESCCGALSLRLGVIIVIVIRIVFFVCLILFYTHVFTDRSDRDKDNTWNAKTGHCFNKDRLDKADLVMLVVTVTIMVLWLLLMIPAVILEVLAAILVGAILEVIIWVWFFFVMAYNISMCIIGLCLIFMLFYSLIWTVVECYVLWLVWSYYVDVKAELHRLRREQGVSDSDSPTSTY